MVAMGFRLWIRQLFWFQAKQFIFSLSLSVFFFPTKLQNQIQFSLTRAESYSMLDETLFMSPETADSSSDTVTSLFNLPI